MRILHILDHSLPLHSGYAFRTQSILNAQRAAGWETLQLTSPKQGESPGTEEWVDTWRYYRSRPSRNGLYRLAKLDSLMVMHVLRHRLEAVIAAERPDILHAHSPVLNALPALSAGRKHRLPVVYEVRAIWEDAAVDLKTARPGDLRYRGSRWLETVALRRCDAITTICEGLRDEIVDRKIAPEKVTVIPNAVDHERFVPGGSATGDLVARHGLEGRTVLGFIGSFYAYEGLDLLLDALPRLSERLPSVKVLLVGGGPEEQRLRAKSRDLGLDERVVFTGRVPQEEVSSYYSLLDLLIYPRHSIRLTEMVTPLKPLEAMAQGMVLLASDIGGHRELIANGKTGFLFPPDDPDLLGDGVVAAIEQRERWPEMRLAGRHFVETERNWQHVVSRYGPIYTRLLKQA